MNTDQNTVRIRKIGTGVPGLDEILHGGLPEYSFNLIAGHPGSGKTTLAHQIMFANVTPERPALYYTVLGEPAIKMLRYQQQFEFLDMSKVERGIHFRNLSALVLDRDLDSVLAEIVKQVESMNPSVVVVDSFRTVVQKTHQSISEMELQSFVQRLAIHLTSWQATTFLIGEYTESEVRDNPVFTVADGIIWMSQQVERNSVVRKLQVLKMRGQPSVPGLHTFRITSAGLQAFPRTFGLTEAVVTNKNPGRLSTGIAELDAMTGGGIPEGDSVLVAGPSGSGKSLLGSKFIAEGLRLREPGVVMVFEERSAQYVRRAAHLGIDLETPLADGMLQILNLQALDLSVDETLHEVVNAIKRSGAKRLVIDSLAGLEMALAPSFRTDFRESLYRMIGVLTRIGVTVMSTVEVQENFTSFPLSSYAVSFLADDIIRLRYVSIDGEIRRVMTVVKMRGGAHSHEIREYAITASGLAVGTRLRGYSGLISGIPRLEAESGHHGDLSLEKQETPSKERPPR